MTLTQFVKGNRKQLDIYIQRICGENPRNDEDRQLWVLNDEGLYTWAQSEGVKI